ncbi:hypothetical protein KI387_031102, partial [Taxus chinensis]
IRSSTREKIDVQVGKMAIDLSIHAHGIRFQLSRVDFSCNKNVLLYRRAWKTKANPWLTMGFTKIIHDCNWKGAPRIKWRQKAVQNGLEDGHEFESSSPKLDVDRLLGVAEVICIVPSLVLSVGFVVQSAAHKFQNVGQGNGTQLQEVLSNLARRGGHDFSLIRRVNKLEEDVGSSVTIIRVLSRQLEKLGVRFRVTRRTLRDPINETASLAQKTSEAVRELAIHEDVLEKELREIQHILFAMQ